MESMESWSNSKTDKFTHPAIWMDRVKVIKRSSGWTEQQTLAAIGLSLKGTAETWFEAMSKDIDGPVVTLEEFEKKFLDRYSKSLPELIMDLIHLQQRDGEDVREFLDRTVLALHDVIDYHRRRCGKDFADGKDLVSLNRGFYFVKGLRKPIRDQVVYKVKDLTDTKELIRLAERNE